MVNDEPWLWTVDQFKSHARKGRIHHCRGRWSKREKAYRKMRGTKTAFGTGLMAGYSLDDIAKFYAVRRGAYDRNVRSHYKHYDPWKAAWEEFTNEAFYELHKRGREEMFSRMTMVNPRRGTDTVKAAVGATNKGDSLGEYELVSLPRGGVMTVDLIASAYEWECPKCGALNRFMEIPKDGYVQCGDCATVSFANEAEHAYP